VNKLLLNKKILKDLDFGLIFTVLLLIVIGIVNIYSATYNESGLYYVKRQILWVGVSVFMMYFLILFDYSIVGIYSELIYWFFNIMLLITYFVAEAINGASGWLNFGPINLQPSEFAKIALCIFLSKKISEYEGKINKFSELMIILGYAAITMVLIVIEPDMGMVMLCFFMVIGIIFVSDISGKKMVVLLACATLAIVITLNFPYLPPYMKERVDSFINGNNTSGSAYQVVQSIVAIGSGKIFGTGFLKSVKTSAGHVPEASTDFIFSVIGEEWGLIGGIVVILLYIILIYRVLKISKNAKNSFGKIFTAGIASLWIFQYFQNIGMTISVMPVTGVTLPFVSYGGSSIMSNFIALGLILNIGMRKKKLMF